MTKKEMFDFMLKELDDDGESPGEIARALNRLAHKHDSMQRFTAGDVRDKLKFMGRR